MREFRYTLPRALGTLHPTADAADDVIAAETAVHGVYEAHIAEVFAATVRSTDRCLDVGANTGLHTALLAAVAKLGKVVAFEPDPRNLPYLRENLKRCSAADVTVVEAAVDAEAGSGRLQPQLPHPPPTPQPPGGA